MNDQLIEAVTDELLAHGEFSSTGNNRPNARAAAQAVIDIILRCSADSEHPVAWRYTCQDGSQVLMLKPLTSEQKRRGYYTGEDGEDEIDGDDATIGPFHWAQETPLYAAPQPARTEPQASVMRSAAARWLDKPEFKAALHRRPSGTEPQTALMARARNALQAARDALRPYAKIDYDMDNQPQPNNAFDVDQICSEAIYEIDAAEPITRCADCPSRYLNGGCSGCPEDAPFAVERSQAEIAK
jgi:hypothetical protein